MKIVFAIIVYDRYDNLKHWLDCWRMCEHHGCDLLVIHNTDTREHGEAFFKICKSKGVLYTSRANIGYDIGAFQHFITWAWFKTLDRIIWVTDDVFCMSTDFIKQFNDAMQPGVGVAAMQVSIHVKKHIRTSAFMIDRTVAERLTFPADPITTKRQCYEFEHMAKNAFYEQIIKMGLKVVQVAPNKTSPLWDSGYRWKLDRQKEHEAIFGKMPEQPEFISKAEHLKNEV